jgi:hypothetical protein
MIPTVASITAAANKGRAAASALKTKVQDKVQNLRARVTKQVGAPKKTALSF